MPRLLSERVDEAGSSTARPIAVDLFAGAGGFGLGLEQAGFDVVAAVEYDPVHAAVHAFNFPRTAVLCKNAATITLNELRMAVEIGLAGHNRPSCPVDVVFGGPPCQGFSAGGKRLKDDERNLLVFDFFRLVRELEPRYWVLENVPPMKNFADPSVPDARLIDRLMLEFDAVGYEVQEPQVLNASRYGVPQDRRRMIMIGARKGCTPLAYPPELCEARPKRATPESKDHGSAVQLGPSVWDAIGDLPDVDDFDELWASDSVRLDEETIDRMSSAGGHYVNRLKVPEEDASDFSYPRQWDPSVLTSARRTRHSDRTVKRFERTPEGAMEPVSRFYRLDRAGLCSTLRAGTGYERGSFMAPRPIHPTLPRVISVREAARLHSFPDWFRFHSSKWHGFRQVGNSLPPLLGRAIGASLMDALKSVPSRPSDTLAFGDVRLLTLATDDAIAWLGADPDSVPSHRLRHRPRLRNAVTNT